MEDNEGGGGGSGLDAGCWPDFYDVQDFQNWLDGVYQGAARLRVTSLSCISGSGRGLH